MAGASGDGAVYEHFDKPVDLSPFSARRRPLFECRSRWQIKMLCLKALSSKPAPGFPANGRLLGRHHGCNSEGSNDRDQST